MKTIIIPTDFSAIATNAMRYGIDMATAIKGSILLLHVYQVPVSYGEVPVALISLDELQKNAQERMEVLKQEVEHITSGRMKVYGEVKLGNVIDELQNLCEKVNPFAVVMGTRGHSAVENVIFGSNTLTAIRHLHWPVICVPPGKTFGTGIKRIGLACDFRDVVNTVPAHAITDLQKEFDAELHVLNVDYHDKHFNASTPEESALLHTLLEEAHPVYHFIENKDVENGINDFAEKNNLDLLITIPKKHKLLQSLFKPGSTRQLVYQSHVPVMCVHE